MGRFEVLGDCREEVEVGGAKMGGEALCALKDYGKEGSVGSGLRLT